MYFEPKEDGFLFKALFKSRTVPYSDIRRIEINDNSIVFSIKDGEEITEKGESNIFQNEALCSAVIRNNIEFRNLHEFKEIERTYTIEEVNELIKSVSDYIRGYVGDAVKKHFGNEYDIDLSVWDSSEYISLCMRLLHNGEVVTDVHEEFRDELYDKVQGCFDCLVIAYLCEWDSVSGCGKYGVLPEALERDALTKSLEYTTDNFIVPLNPFSIEYID